ncbi:hypothetical protein Tco_0962989 [Tanacetum coccineum]
MKQEPLIPKRVHFINLIVILSKEIEAKKEGSVKPNAAEYKDHKRVVEVKEEETGLVYDKDEGTIKFEKEGENIIFKMPHKMEMFKHIKKDILKTNNIPSFRINGDNGNQEKTHYSDNLNLGPAYRRDESTIREIQSLIKIKSRRNEGGVTLYLMSRSLKVLRKFSDDDSRGRFN